MASSSSVTDAATMKQLPMAASCSTVMVFPTHRNRNANTAAAPNAATWTAARDGSIPQMFSATIATPATCAVARSMKTIPRLRTSMPRGACSTVHRRQVAEIDRGHLPQSPLLGDGAVDDVNAICAQTLNGGVDRAVCDETQIQRARRIDLPRPPVACPAWTKIDLLLAELERNPPDWAEEFLSFEPQYPLTSLCHGIDITVVNDYVLDPTDHRLPPSSQMAFGLAAPSLLLRGSAATAINPILTRSAACSGDGDQARRRSVHECAAFVDPKARDATVRLPRKQVLATPSLQRSPEESPHPQSVRLPGLQLNCQDVGVVVLAMPHRRRVVAQQAQGNLRFVRNVRHALVQHRELIL